MRLVCVLDEVELLQVVPEDGVLHGDEHEADVLRVRGAREVGVNGLLAVGVLLLVHLQDELASCLRVLRRTWGR